MLPSPIILIFEICFDSQPSVLNLAAVHDGDEITAFVQEVQKQHMWVTISPCLNGRLPRLEARYKKIKIIEEKKKKGGGALEK